MNTRLNCIHFIENRQCKLPSENIQSPYFNHSPPIAGDNIPFSSPVYAGTLLASVNTHVIQES